MALSNYKLNYTKDWRNASDFSTYENSEAQVRADLQLLFTEMQVAFNNFLDALAAAEVPFSPTAEIDSATVQAAIENVQGQIAGMATGSLPDNSIETAKYKNGSVTFAKLGSDVTPTNLGAAPAVHDHDGRYYTETEANALLADKQTRTALLPAMAAEVADGDSIPLYDLSDAAAKKLSYMARKAALKTYFDMVYGVILEAHADRHAADGADPITVSTGNLAADAVTEPKLADAAVTAPKIAAEAVSKLYSATIPGTGWKSKYTRNTTVSGLIKDETVTASSGDLDLRAVASATDTLDLTLIGTKPESDTTVKLVVTGARPGWNVEDISAGTYSTTITVAVADWVGDAAPYLQEISVPGLLASDNPILDFVPSASYATAENELDAWAEIYRFVATADTLTVYAQSATTTAVNIQILCVRR